MKNSVAGQSPIRILLAEDDETDFALIKHYLEQIGTSTYELIWAPSYEEAAERLKQEQFAACLVDYRLGQLDGLEFIRRFAKTQNAPPMILVTGSWDKELDGRARESGAVDCLRKVGLSPQLLERSLRYAIAHQDYQQRLWRSREHYRQIVDHALNAITVIDQDGTITEWNPEAERLFGWRREEIIGRKLEETIILERRIPNFRAWLAVARQSEQSASKSQSSERALRHKDGREIRALVNTARIADARGVTFVTFYGDLTAKKEALEAMRRYERIVRSTSDFISLVDNNLVFVAANDSYADAFGLDLAQIVGHRLDEVFDQKVINEVVLPHARRWQTGEAGSYEAWISYPKYGRRFMSVRYSPYRDDDGKITGAVIHARDITERKRAEEALERSNRLINAVMKVETGYIHNVKPEELFSDLLNAILSLTESEFGFIGEILTDRSGAPYFKTYALTDISWDDDSRALYAKTATEGMEFHALKSLYGAAITSAEPVISNDAANDPRAGGLPSGHPPLRTFLGLPFKFGKELVGMMGIANRPDGYDEDMIHYLDPITSACAGIIHSWRSDKRLSEAELRFRHVYDENPAMLFTVNEEGIVLSANKFALHELGYEWPEIVANPIDKILHTDDVELWRNALQEAFAAPNTVRRWELRMRRKNGETIWVRETVRVTSDTAGGQSALIVSEDITGARALSEQLSHQASHDSLTDLVNRREFERRLANSINGARFHDSEHALCYIDLDQFKLVNDTAGHIAGDALLRELARLLSARIRRRDTLARLGGDEFGVLIDHCALPQACHIAENLLDAIREYRFSWEGRRFSVGASIGIVPINASSGDAAELMRLVDSACYMAKDAGRNMIRVYEETDELVRQRHSEMLWVERINTSLEKNLFRLTCQPIVPVHFPTRRGHYEILLRLFDEGTGLVPPGAFLPAAERYGIIGKIDRWVISTWFAWLGEHRAVLDKLKLSTINLSGHSLADPGLLDFIQQETGRHQVPPQKIGFEITETVAIANLGAATKLIQDLRKQGFRFALDDFGSGLSSFAYLRTLPVDYVKIDGIFVKDIAEDPLDRVLVRSINEIVKALGKQAIAEFVENDEALLILQEIGVAFAQGYGIGRPEPIETLLD